MKLSTLLLVVTVLAITSCESDTDSGNTPAALIPLTEGNLWIYENSTYDSLGNLTRRVHDTVTLRAATTIDAQIWYPVFHAPEQLPLSDSSYYGQKPDGIWSRSSFSTNLRYKYPTAANDTFNLRISQPFPVEGTLEKTFTMTVTPNASVTIPLGTFSAVHYRSYFQSIDSVTKEVRWSSEPSDQYVAPGVGLVKSVYQSFIGFPGTLNTHESVLIYYSLK